MFYMLCVHLRALGCKLQMSNELNIETGDGIAWNMETDRACLSEEYDLLRSTGATDACYGFC